MSQYKDAPASSGVISSCSRQNRYAVKSAMEKSSGGPGRSRTNVTLSEVPFSHVDRHLHIPGICTRGQLGFSMGC